MTDPGPRIWDFEELPPGCLEGTELERITKDLYPLLASFGSQVGRIKPAYKTHTVVVGKNQELVTPWSIAIDRKGQLVIVEHRHHQVQIFSPAGAPLLKWGRRGSELGELEFPVGLAILQNGTILVSEYSNHRISFFDEQGKALKTIGSLGNAHGQLLCPCDIALTREENIVVADSTNRRIQILSLNGDFLMKIELPQYPRRQELRPTGVKVDSKTGNIICTDNESSVIRIFSPQGKVLKTFMEYGSSRLLTPWTSSVDRDGNVIASDYGHDRICILDPHGEVVQILGEEVELKYPMATTVDYRGNLYVCDFENNRIVMWS